MSSSQITSSNHSSSDHSDICAVCLEPVASSGRRYALLERCDHRYCEPCGRSLVAHRDLGQTTVRCPTCRVPSNRLIVSSDFLTVAAGSGPAKAALFDAILCCADHRVGHGGRAHQNTQGEEDDYDDEIGPVYAVRFHEIPFTIADWRRLAEARANAEAAAADDNGEDNTAEDDEEENPEEQEYVPSDQSADSVDFDRSLSEASNESIATSHSDANASQSSDSSVPSVSSVSASQSSDSSVPSILSVSASDSSAENPSSPQRLMEYHDSSYTESSLSGSDTMQNNGDSSASSPYRFTSEDFVDSEDNDFDDEDDF